MLLNTDLLVQFVPGWGMWIFGPRMGGFNFLLFLLLMFLLFSFLRGAGHRGGYNRRRGGYYPPGPPQYHSGHPYPGHGPSTGDVTQREQTTGESRGYGPGSGHQSMPYGSPPPNPYAGYETGAAPGGEGQATVRVDSQSSGDGEPTRRVTPPAATMRMESVETGGQSTTPLAGTPGQPSEKAPAEPGEVGRTKDYDN